MKDILQNEYEASHGEIVYVPVPQKLLRVVYQALAQALAENSEGELSVLYPATPITTKRNLIDLIMKVAYGIGADQHPVTLTELYTAYLRAYPGIGKGATRGSFDATINYHCINMRSRFPDQTNKYKTAYWITRPAFKRVARARYMLLSAGELAQFRHLVAERGALIYEDEYEVSDMFNLPSASTPESAEPDRSDEYESD